MSAERVRQNDMAYTLASVTAVRAIDDHTVEMETRAPNPILLQDLTLFFVMSRGWVQANNAMAVARAGQPGAGTAFPQLNANGTGPFRLVERVADERTVLVPNPQYWDAAAMNHGITRAVFRPIASAPTRLAALLSRELDAMYHVPLQNVPQVQQQQGIRLVQGPTARSIYFAFDVTRPRAWTSRAGRTRCSTCGCAAPCTRRSTWARSRAWCCATPPSPPASRSASDRRLRRVGE
jgi:peptide/nickel transport system substrate-binding protein